MMIMKIAETTEVDPRHPLQRRGAIPQLLDSKDNKRDDVPNNGDNNNKIKDQNKYEVGYKEKEKK